MTAIQYQAIINRLIKQHDIKVGKYYTSFHGNASITERKIWIPKPVCETSVYIALHEIGHIVAGLEDKEPEWLHEYSATKYALDQATIEGIEFSGELIKAAKGYLKKVIYTDIQKIYLGDIPNKVFRFAGINKYYWQKQEKSGKRMLRTGEVHVGAFRQLANIKIKWVA